VTSEAARMGMTSAEKMRARRDRLKADGMCIRACGRKARKGKTECGPCAEEGAERKRRARA